MSFSDLVGKIRQRVSEEADPAKIGNLNAVFQFELTGDDGGTFHAKVADGKAEVVEAAHDNPNVTIIMAAEDFLKLAEGKLNPTSAFMSGKLKIKGDMSLALKLQSLIGSARL
ncbi:MAG TPA: SCP2 sterol-binding domain-containing protein [Bacillota bacterium]|nr:SCP2 sterol-binding domain-containing protein [Bacillota bacterium]HOB87827.1 SCP2 sterol-binding domain-containing protein [Bacillota bacterium]HOP69498.1 SCP2 sterol-binding domain-containing protein [Bacillota bacterium]HPT34492.1 SCP2 sterol-binding domain-containing protein [Bacillota bacterium]HPZ65573.1 SCP2 sterol-binding domain-containing protein [Bacillota bacterium]